MKYAAININFDSLGEAYGFPQGFRDPCFFEVADRFMELADRYDFRYSIYVIGKDLERPENRQAVARWSSEGHEIGNHSWSHRHDLGALDASDIRAEVERAHRIIEEVTGRLPEGFIAPGWSISSSLLEVLIDLGYTYDTSSFPSWLLMPALAKLSIKQFGDPRGRRIWKRRDLFNSIVGSRQVFDTSGSLKHRPGSSSRKADSRTIRELPLPTTRFRVACWHTLSFVFGWSWQRRIIASCLEDIDAFYYLVHPADLMETSDLDPGRKCSMERMDTPLDRKLFYMEEAIKLILASDRRIVTMRELAEKCPAASY